jgi:hypothetical protein
MSDLDKWELARDLNVPLWLVNQVEKNFWEYIEDPKKRKKYKTTYFTVRKWINMGIDNGKYQHNNEVEAMMLQSQHPDMKKRLEEAKKIAEEKGLVE